MHINTTLNKLQGKRPDTRERGSRPDEQLYAIRLHSPNVICKLTGDSPREHLFKYGTTYSLQLNHKIPYHILPAMYFDRLEVLSPNGHQHITNIQRNITEIKFEDAEICECCKLNNYEYYIRTKLVVTFHTHHIDGNRKNNTPNNKQRLCPNCHYATDSHSVNKDKDPFRNKWPQFLEHLHDRRSVGFMTRKLNVSKGHLQWNFYKTGLDLHFGRDILEPPKIIRHLFDNDNAHKFFNI